MITLANGRDTVTGTILNLSNGGMGLNLDELVEPMSTVHFTIRTAAEEIKGYTEACYLRGES